MNFFRELLASSTPEREQRLAGQKPEQRLALQNKLREYELLSPEERELRLRALDLRWYLSITMRMAPGNRVEFLKSIPESDRFLVEERLRHWDRWSPDLQKELLENEMAIRILVGTETVLGRPSPAASGSLKARELAQTNLANYLKLPEQKRQEIHDRFRQIFDLRPDERTRVLDPLSQPERAAMEKTLQVFARLPRTQREQCISGFKKFAALSPLERMQFLSNAERWEAMDAKDRQAWRNLVNRVKLPPLPPAFRFPPPLPLPTRASSSLAATNNKVAGADVFPTGPR